ncbi:MAG: HIT family protein [Nanoarchaeota archaeon]|nr:HIT family protein [Nanoarchaeota archaeon]MBU1850135.1 HIT family protein [Nanoarchaeota archaeon]
MQSKLPKPFDKAMIYENSKLYVCLANYPIVKGHTIIVWKESVTDLHLLSKKDYEHLMDKVDEIRNALLKTLKIKKVYLIYMDETNQVHWHLVPRYNERGFDVFQHKPSKLTDFSLTQKIKRNLVLKI